VAKFVFKLRAALTQRKWLERSARLELAARQRDLDAAAAALARLEQELRDANAFARDHTTTGRVNVNLLVQHRRYLLGQQQRLVDAARAIELATQNRSAAQAKLNEASARRKAVELLRDKQFEQWRQTQAKAEQDLLDEAGTQLAFEDLSS
jgi:flagellar protein FliJ